ncbi:hypothetical protein [Aquimonas sp.]|jgi:hypothetical protein|uniref:hypothetical protein n=1 Tax=Aquimonas sp. TaxID=1872588 RepID=UPI0037C06E0F
MRQFLTAHLMIPMLAFAALACAVAPPARAQVQWRSSPIVYTPVQDIVTGYTPNGTGYYISQAYIPSPPQPTVGQPFYLSVLAAGIAVPATGRLVGPYLQLPAGVSIVANAATPLRCFYKAMDGSGSYIEFTNQVITDQSFGASLRVAGCPQPSQQALPIFALGDGSGGSGILIQRRDPQAANSPLWPMGSQASYEFLVPVVSSQPLDGFSAATRFRAPINSIQGDLGSLWAYPVLPLLVHPASSGSGSADMRVSSLQSVTPTSPLNRRVVARCQNFGPSAAQNASCSFTRLPPNASQGCSPAGIQPSLAMNAFIECWAEFPGNPDGDTVEVLASSSTPDPTPGNNGVGVSLQPMVGGSIFGNGFEN